MKISPVPQMILTIIFFSYRSQNSGELFPKGPASNSIILKKVTLFQGIRQSEPRDPRSSKVYKVIRIQLQQSKERKGGGMVFEIFNLAGVAVVTLVVCYYCVWSEKVGTDWMFYGTSTSWKIEKKKQKKTKELVPLKHIVKLRQGYFQPSERPLIFMLSNFCSSNSTFIAPE